MKRPKPGSKNWMEYVRSCKGKKKSKKSTKSKRPEVIVSIPKNAKLTVKRKARNPYYVKIKEGPSGKTTKEYIKYTPEYERKM